MLTTKDNAALDEGSMLRRVLSVGSYFGLAITIFSNLQSVVNFAGVISWVTSRFTALNGYIVNTILGWFDLNIPKELALIVTSTLCLVVLVLTTWFRSDHDARSGEFRAKARYGLLAHRKWGVYVLISVILTIIFVAGAFFLDVLEEARKGEPYIVSLLILLSVTVFFIGACIRNFLENRKVAAIIFVTRRKENLVTMALVAVVAALLLFPIILPVGEAIFEKSSAPEKLGPTATTIVTGVLFILPSCIAVWLLLNWIGHRVSRRMLNNRLKGALVLLAFFLAFNMVALVAEKFAVT